MRYNSGINNKRKDNMKDYYELTILTDTNVDVSEEDIKSLASGDIIKYEDEGIKRLAYRIRDNEQAHYYYIDIKSTETDVKNMNHKMANTEWCLRYLILKVEKRH